MSKKILLVVTACITLLFTISGCSRGYKVDYGTSEKYSKADMDAAIEVAMERFGQWKGCTMQRFEYTGDSFSESQLGYCAQFNLEANYIDCMVLKSDFKTPKDLDPNLTFNADCEYEGWQWYLAREEDGQWELVQFGY